MLSTERIAKQGRLGKHPHGSPTRKRGTLEARRVSEGVKGCVSERNTARADGSGFQNPAAIASCFGYPSRIPLSSAGSLAMPIELTCPGCGKQLRLADE